MQPYANRRTIPFWQAVGVFALFTLGCLWWTRTPWALGGPPVWCLLGLLDNSDRLPTRDRAPRRQSMVKRSTRVLVS
jgi:hypothetical protein